MLDLRYEIRDSGMGCWRLGTGYEMRDKFVSNSYPGLIEYFHCRLVYPESFITNSESQIPYPCTSKTVN
jgi:hypothetical protein